MLNEDALSCVSKNCLVSTKVFSTINCFVSRNLLCSSTNLSCFFPGGGGTPLYGLYGDVPLDRVCFFGLSALNRVYNFMRTCPRQGLNLS